MGPFDWIYTTLRYMIAIDFVRFYKGGYHMFERNKSEQCLFSLQLWNSLLCNTGTLTILIP